MLVIIFNILYNFSNILELLHYFRFYAGWLRGDSEHSTPLELREDRCTCQTVEKISVWKPRSEIQAGHIGAGALNSPLMMRSLGKTFWLKFFLTWATKRWVRIPYVRIRVDDWMRAIQKEGTEGNSCQTFASRKWLTLQCCQSIQSEWETVSS